MAAEKQQSTADLMLWIVAALAAVAGFYGFFYLEGQAMLLVRVLVMLAGIGLALLVAARTERGREFFSYLREVDVERRKVVWPTRQETFQTTLIVLVVTIIVALILFLMDALFGGLVRWLIGAGGGL